MIKQDFNRQCERCGKIFKRSEELKDHMDGHNGLKNHKCELCTKHTKLKKFLGNTLIIIIEALKGTTVIPVIRNLLNKSGCRIILIQFTKASKNINVKYVTRPFIPKTI